MSENDKSTKDHVHTATELQEVTPTSTSTFDEPKKESIRHIPLFLSQYAWFLIILTFIAYGFFFPRKHPAQLFKSKSPSHPWNSSEVPMSLIFTLPQQSHSK